MNLKEAKQIDAQIRSFSIVQRNNYLEMGKLAFKMRESGAFKLLGYKTMDVYTKSLGKSRAAVYEAMKIVDSFKDIPKDRAAFLPAVPKENLKLLSKLPERQRFASEYLQKAATLKAKDLKMMLNHKNYHVGDTVVMKFTDVPMEAEPRIRKAIEAARIIANTSSAVLHPLEMLAHEFLTKKTKNGKTIEEMMDENSRVQVPKAGAKGKK